MKTLLILRHAKAAPKGPNISDHDRPLDELGEADPHLMGGFGVSPDLPIGRSRAAV